MNDSVTESREVTPTEPQAGFVMIPADYDHQDVVPICIRTVDDSDRPVEQGWIDAVTGVADPLRSLARRVIGDVWRVSELAEGSVHALSARHGADLGACPEGRIWVDASWRARDLAAGGRRARVGREVGLTDYMLASLADAADIGSDFENRERLDRIAGQLWRAGETDVLVMLHLYETGAQDMIPDLFGVEPDSRERNALSQRFRRGLARAAKTL